MNSAKRAFRLSPAAAARLSFVLGLGLTGAATLTAVPALYAQAARSDLAIQSDVMKTLGTYPDLSGQHITATAKNGVVTLAGTASSDTVKNQAQVVAATVDGVQSVVNNITVVGGDSVGGDSVNEAQPDAGSQDQNAQQPIQQAQSNDPNQQQVPYTPQQQPNPGGQGQWGQAGPPPDVQNGTIPQQPQAGQQDNQYPMQDPGQDENAPQQQPARPAYPPQQQPQYPQQQPQYPQQQPQYPQSQPQYPQQSPYPQQPGYGPPAGQYPQAQQPYQQVYPPQGVYQQQRQVYAAPQLSTAPLSIPPGTLFTVRTSEPLDSRKLKGDEGFQAVLAQDIYQGAYLAVPRGAVLQGHVIGVKKPGELRGEAGFALQITSLNLGGLNYPVATDTFAANTRGKGGHTTANTVGGAAIGALIGAAAGGGEGAAIGAIVGGGAGLGASAASAGPRYIMPPETLLTFHLAEPLTVNPISLAEVQQLQASVTPRVPPRPARPVYPYGYPPPPPPPPPGYYYPRYYR